MWRRTAGDHNDKAWNKGTSRFKAMLAHLRSQPGRAEAPLDKFWAEALPSPRLQFLHSSPKLTKDKAVAK